MNTHLPLFFTASADGILHVRGRHDSPYRRINLYVSKAEWPNLERELPAHLLMPPIWKIPEMHPAFASGYLAAQRWCIGVSQSFQAVTSLLHAPPDCPYSDPEDQQAFTRGAEHYRDTLLQLMHGQTHTHVSSELPSAQAS